MAKETFYNLSPEKKNRIIEVLRDLFKKKPFQQVTVKEIVEELGIARGSFYQYFDDLEDAYFEILNEEVVDIHELFMALLQERSGELKASLEEYGEAISALFFAEERYPIYRNRYLYWDERLACRWEEVHQTHLDIFAEPAGGGRLETEKMHYMKGVIHMLIQRNFREQWTKEVFLKKYRQHINWMMEGIANEHI